MLCACFLELRKRTGSGGKCVSVAAIYMGPGVVQHDSDDAPGVNTTTIAAEDVGAAGQAGKLQHEELEAVGLGGLTAGSASGRDGGGCMV